MLFLIFLVFIPAYSCASVYLSNQLSYRPNEASQDWYYSRGIPDAPKTACYKLPSVEWSARVEAYAIFTSRQYASTNILDPVFLWPIQPQKLQGGDAFAQPKSDVNVALPGVGLEIRDFEVLGARGRTVIDGEFGSLTVLGGAFAYSSAFIELAWSKHKLLVGQALHPMVPENLIPNLLGPLEGTPITPKLSFTGQLKHTYLTDTTELSTAVYTNTLVTDNGPNNFSADYQRQACIPGFNICLQKKIRDSFTGFGLNTHRILPNIINTAPTYSNPTIPFTINSSTIWFTNAYAFFSYLRPESIIRGQLIYGQNGNNLYMLGGYAIESVNQINKQTEYTPIPFMSCWIDYARSSTSCIQPGIFVGYTAMLNVRKKLAVLPINKEIDAPVAPVAYTLDGVYTNEIYNPQYYLTGLFRTSPRIWFKVFDEHITCGAEIIYAQGRYSRLLETGSFRTIEKTSCIRFTFETVVTL